MNNNEILEKLKELKIEDNIWIIYIIIIILSWYSNELERKYYLYDDPLAKKQYREIIVTIFTILLIIYLYFFKSSLTSVRNLKIDDPFKKINLSQLSLLASLLIVISGAIFLYIALEDESIDIELAFN